MYPLLLGFSLLITKWRYSCNILFSFSFKPINVGNLAVSNGSSANYICYAWHGVDGYSKFGKYSGNGNANGPFIYTGFRPRLLILKRTSSAGGFRIWDTQRHTFNPNDAILRWNDSGAEDTANQAVDFLSNGFKLRITDSAINGDAGEYLYYAIGQTMVGTNNVPATAR